MVDSALQVWSGEYNGLHFGVGTPYHLVSGVNLFAAATKSQDIPIPRGHGSIPAYDYLNARDLPLEFTVVADNNNKDDSERFLWELLRAFTVARGWVDPTPGGKWLRWRARTGTFRVLADVAQLQAPFTPRAAQSGGYNATVLLNLSDPRVYGDLEQVVRVPGRELLGRVGWELPTDLPLDTTIPGGGATLLPNPATVFHAGTGAAYPTVRVVNQSASPINGFVVEELNTGQRIEVIETINAGSSFVMDQAGMERSGTGPYVTLDGVNRYLSWQTPRRTLELIPGQSLIRFTPGAPSAPVTNPDVWLILTYYPTYD